jgi:hypothetical protein
MMCALVTRPGSCAVICSGYLGARISQRGRACSPYRRVAFHRGMPLKGVGVSYGRASYRRAAHRAVYFAGHASHLISVPVL